MRRILVAILTLAALVAPVTAQADYTLGTTECGKINFGDRWANLYLNNPASSFAGSLIKYVSTYIQMASTCTGDQVVVRNTGNTAWECRSLPAVVGDLTGVSVAAGGGLTGGGSTGNVTVGLLTTCSDNQILKWDTAGSAWGCEADADTTYSARSGFGVEFSSTTIGLITTCADGQVLKSAGTGTSWACGSDNDTTYSDMVGDSGAGGTHGLAPAPGAGDAAAGKFLSAGGTWSVPTAAPVFDVGDGEVALAAAVVTAGVGNTGVGSMAVASGTRSGLFEIEILTTGDLGVATFQWRRAGGAWEDNQAAGYTTAADVELTAYDSDKEASVPSGQHIQFSAGGEGDDFADGDTFSFTPVLTATLNHASGEVTVPLVTPEGDYDDFMIESTEIASGQKVISDGVMQPAASGGFTSNAIPFVIRKTVAAGSITFRALNMGATLDGKAVLTFAGLPE
ncbi:MAG: hypothetical protein KBD01_18225 [Acidobacteria bacterium]|nr:hypothetical protein [Acidobacteriota bacterium]